MPRLKSLSLRVHLGRRTLTYALVHRTDDGRTVFDRALSTGTIPLEHDPSGLLDVLSVLRETIRALEGTDPAGDPAQRPGALEGGGGRLTVPLAVVCGSQCPGCGQHLDGRSLGR